MPNWCHNSFTVSHKDPAMITKFAEAVRAGNLFETFVPLSSGEWDYNVACDEWGTKWDISAGDVDVAEDSKSCSGWFETAWSPGTIAYERLFDLGFDLDIVYHEPGMSFAGRFVDGYDLYFEYNFNEENWRKEITDEEVLEFLEKEYESWLQWREEEKEDDGA